MRPLTIGAAGLCLAVAVSLPGNSRAGSSTSYGPMYASYKLSPGKGGGCISGSVGTAGPANAYSYVNFVSEANADSTLKQGNFSYVKGNTKADIAPRVGVFTMCMKPGRYRLYGVATNMVYSTERVAVPFEVIAGKNVYLGSFVFQGPGTRPDCERGAPVYVTVADEFERDSVSIRKDPQGGGLPLEKRVVDPAPGTPYFVSCDA